MNPKVGTFPRRNQTRYRIKDGRHRLVKSGLSAQRARELQDAASDALEGATGAVHDYTISSADNTYTLAGPRFTITATAEELGSLVQQLDDVLEDR